ncbi:MAG: HAMP domain-containing sensor histidine kinase [Litorilinea sp.]
MAVRTYSGPKVGPRNSADEIPAAHHASQANAGFPMTIRLRLTLWYTALLGTTLILFSFIFYSALAANLWTQTQQDAARQAGEIAATLTQQLQGDILIIRTNPARIQFPDLEFFAGSLGVQVIDLNGMILKRSSNMGPMTVHNYRKGLDQIRTGASHSFYTTGENNMPLLVYSAPIVANNTIVGAAQVIKPVSNVQNTLSQVSRYLIFGTALSLVLAAIVGAFLARRALAPIDRITGTVSVISRTKDLSRRLDVKSDASEVGLLAAAFNEMLDRIQQLFKSQERLIADVSHELRTPLTTIQGNVELLKRRGAQLAGDLPQNQETAAITQEMLNEVESETNRMSSLIRDLLLLAQADSGAVELQFEPVEVDTLLLDVYRQAQRMANHRKGQGALEIRLGSEDQALVMGDRERLRQVLLNLTDNAIKYTARGGTITLSLEKTKGWVTVSVRDTGIGISPEDQVHVFDRFYRTDRARRREEGGSGLGLSIVQWIIAVHNGRLELESTPGQGSTFTVILPAIQPTAEPAPVAPANPNPGGRLPTKTIMPPSSR